MARHERGQLLRFLASAFGGLTAPGQHAVFGTSRVQWPGVTGTSAKADGLTPKESLLARRFALVAPLLPQCQGRRSLVGIRRFD